MKKYFPLSLYWKCQLYGWTAAALYWEVDAYIRSAHFNYIAGIINFLADVVINILLTHTYRHYALKRHWHTLRPQALVIRIIPAILVLAAAFMVTVTGRFFLSDHYFFHRFTGTFPAYLQQSGWVPFMTGLRIMSIWVLAWHLYHYAQREIKTTRENARLQLMAKEAQLNNLSSQLNPHFFFNSLNNIKSLVLEDPQLARRAIDLLSELLRTSLYSRSGKLIPVSQELAMVKDYLELEKLRFEERLEVVFQVDEQLLPTLIPPLSIQTLVENAIKHGIDKSRLGGQIIISIYQTSTGINISVQNPGRLQQAPATPGLGIKNLEERLQLQFAGNAAFHITALPEEKVLSVISISRV